MSVESKAGKKVDRQQKDGWITIEGTALNGTKLQATYATKQGMNLVSFLWGDQELIDQETMNLFHERQAGLGALIGPHFHRRNPKILPKVAPDLFPHIKGLPEGQDPFSHGIARYVPWQADSDGSSIQATVSGKDTYQGVALKELEGQDFIMNYRAAMTEKGLKISLSVCSDSDSVVGLHYYFALPKQREQAIVRSSIRPRYFTGQEILELPEAWQGKTRNDLQFCLSQEADYGFQPYPKSTESSVVLDTGNYHLQVQYQTESAENRWQLYSPEGASFVCIEPMTAENPTKPQLTVSSINVLLSVVS